MRNSQTFWLVSVNGQPKGEVWRDVRGRCWWYRPNGAKESYPPGTTLFGGVRDHIARLCNTYGNAVEFRKARRR